jgi:hypothetical protein
MIHNASVIFHYDIQRMTAEKTFITQHICLCQLEKRAGESGAVPQPIQQGTKKEALWYLPKEIP